MLRDRMQFTMRKSMVVVFVVLLIIAGVALLPLAVVWAVGTLSGADIEYNFLNWLAAAVLIGIVALAAQL